MKVYLSTQRDHFLVRVGDCNGGWKMSAKDEARIRKLLKAFYACDETLMLNIELGCVVLLCSYTFYHPYPRASLRHPGPGTRKQQYKLVVIYPWWLVTQVAEVWFSNCIYTIRNPASTSSLSLFILSSANPPASQPQKLLSIRMEIEMANDSQLHSSFQPLNFP